MALHTLISAAPAPDDSIPLHPVTADALDSVQGAAAWATASGFEAVPGACLLVPGADGRVSAVVFIIDPNSDPDTDLGRDPWWLASAPAALPAASYRLVGDFTTEALTMGAYGWALAHYRFDHYKSDAKGKQCRLHLPGAPGPDLVPLLDATSMIRDLVNMPAEDMGPADLEATAGQLAAAFEAHIDVIRGDRLLDALFPSIHAVGRAAATGKEPRLIEILWEGSKASTDAPKIVLVGKGVCFDTGGLNLKPGTSMRWMKKDMGGAAHALGLAQAIMALDLPVNVRVLIPAVENAVDGGAFRPGDVLATRLGKSVEIGNTDAEGRLILSDALTYATESSPDLILDFATLTGAARVALGPDLPPVYSNDEAIWDRLNSAAKAVGDPIWRMPLHGPYRDMLKSQVADIHNISDGPFAGSITAALFLEEFVAGKPWVHLDVFAWRPSDLPGRPFGGAAQGLMATLGLVKSLAAR